MERVFDGEVKLMRHKGLFVDHVHRLFLVGAEEAYFFKHTFLIFLLLFILLNRTLSELP